MGHKPNTHQVYEVMLSADASTTAQAILDWLTEMRNRQEDAWKIVTEEDDKVQDFLHEMEFEANSKKRAVISTRLHDSRCRRREAKDTAKKLKPLAEFVREAQNRNLIKMIKKMQVDLKSAEEYVNSKRVYKPRGVKDGDGE